MSEIGIILTENQAISILDCFTHHYRRTVLNVDLFGYLKRRDMVFTPIESYDDLVTSFVIEIKPLDEDIHIPFVLFYHFGRPSVHVNDVSLTGWLHKTFIDELIELLKDFDLLKGDSDGITK